MIHRYRRKIPEIEAFQHDGTESSAIKISNWINLYGPYSAVIPMGSEESGYDKTFAYIRLLTRTPRSIIAPGSWVVKMADTVFYTLSNEEFTLVYEPIPEEENDGTTTETGRDTEPTTVQEKDPERYSGDPARWHG
jgi:hypothetical protein